MTNSETESVRFDGVVKKYGSVTAIKKLDLNIESGKLVTFLEPIGCVKITVL